MSDLSVFSSPGPSVGAGVPPLTAQKKGCVQAVIRSGLLTHFSEQEALCITSFFAASKHNQPFLGISSKINSLTVLPSA